MNYYGFKGKFNEVIMADANKLLGWINKQDWKFSFQPKTIGIYCVWKGAKAN